MAAQSARSFGDTIGVNVRLTYLDTPAYKDFAPLHLRLRELGVRYVSDSLCPTCEYQINRLQLLAQSGIKANLGIGWLSGGTSTIAPGLQALRTRLLGSVASIASVNEPDISGDPQWVAHTRAFQQDLYRQANADPLLAGLPVIGPSLVYRGSRAELGDLSAHLDRGSLHPYSGGLPPLGNLAEEALLMAQVSGAKPLDITEVGYHTDLAYNGPHRPASEQAVATYTPRIALEAFRWGIERTYIYQFADIYADGQAPVSPSENSFGLLHSNLTPKPSFYALRNLLRVVDGDSASVASPGGLRVGLEGAGADVRRLLLRSADGSYALVLWRPASVWDRDAQRDISPTPDRLDVVMGQPISLAQRFDPVDSDAERQRWSDPRRITVDLAGKPVVLRLRPQ